MKITLQLDYGYYKNSCEKFFSKFYQLAEYTFKLLNIKLNEIIVEVSFVSENKIKKINNDFRNKNSITDVISFALWDIGIKTPLLGELYICINKAKEQAKEYKHSFEREICFLFIHGLLHLLGYDHQNKHDEKKMFSLQEKILNHFNIKR